MIIDKRISCTLDTHEKEVLGCAINILRSCINELEYHNCDIIECEHYTYDITDIDATANLLTDLLSISKIY